LAIAPQSNEAFLREVDEQVRLDTAQRFWKRWGKLVIVLFVVALLALAGGLWWNAHKKSVAGVDGETLSIALDDLTESRVTKAETALKSLETSDTAGYRASSRLALAASKLVKNDIKGAVADYDKIAADTSLGQPFRDAATVRGVAAGFDTMKPEQIIAKLKPLAVAKNPWFGSAGEMTAIAYMKMNKPREAGALFAAIAKDESVPESIRQRSVQLASAMGIDVGPLNIKNRN
jgi:hypothetical protein